MSPRRAGVTLIEVMIAITIFAMVGSLVYTTFVQTARQKTRVEQDLDHHHVIEASLERMARELSMAFISTQLNPTLSRRVSNTIFLGTDRGRRDRVDFTSFSHQRLFRDAHESDQNEISYFLAADPNEPGAMVLARRMQNRIDEDPTRGGIVQVLLEGVDELEFEFLDPTTGLWLPRWDSSSAAAQLYRLPTQVKIRVRVVDPRNPRRHQVFGTRATLPITFGLNHATYGTGSR